MLEKDIPGFIQESTVQARSEEKINLWDNGSEEITGATMPLIIRSNSSDRFGNDHWIAGQMVNA